MLSTIIFWTLVVTILGTWIWLLIDFALDVKNGYLEGDKND